MTPSTQELDELARDVERVESVHEVKDVQRAYAHLAQFGRWDAVAALFAENGTVRWAEQTVTGRDAIARWLADRGAAAGRPGALHTEVVEQPLVNLSVDGRTAAGRWNGMRFLGDGAGEARIEAGIHENTYVREGGRWRIASLHFHPLYEGDYETGWTNTGGRELPIVAPHFTLDEVGVPIPAPDGPAPHTGATAAQLAERIDRLNDEDAVRNLQNAYGYYVDRRMWADVVDLFGSDPGDAVVRVDGVGEYRGADGVRRAMERMGPEGMSHGTLNDHPIFDLIVDVRPGGREAFARGIEIGMLGDTRTGTGAWEFSVFRNRFVKDGGLWRLREVRVTPLLTADYAQGWGHGGTGPRVSCPAPAFLDPARPPAAGRPEEPGPDIAELRRRLARSRAYDGVENVSAAYGYYLDDFQWPEMAGLFAVHGNKQSPFAGYYIGRERIMGAATAFYGGPRAADSLRARISFHWRTQPVVIVSRDGRSATLRTRLFQPRTSMTVTPGFTGFAGGMYPNDQAVLEDGRWRLWSLTIDEHYFASPTWHGGWAAAQDPPDGTPDPPPSRLLTVYPPDITLTELGVREEGFRGGTGRTVVWPGVLPMWFHYRNPVSGRVPERYWPDCVPAELRPDTRMTAHGYQMPPSGPSADGVELDARP
jgi:hypothetical protein